MNENGGEIDIDDMYSKPRSIAFIRIQIKDAEKDSEYWTRRFADLDSKSSLTEAQEKDRQRVLRKLQKLNKRLADLRTEEEIGVDIAKAHSEGRSYFPIAGDKRHGANEGNLFSRENVEGTLSRRDLGPNCPY